jgi:hypothetical protein
VIRGYSKFRLPALAALAPSQLAVTPTLADQAAGDSPLLPAGDLAETSTGNPRLSLATQQRAVALYQQGRSLTSISRDLHVAWDSVARMLDRGGVRTRRAGRAHPPGTR